MGFQGLTVLWDFVNLLVIKSHENNLYVCMSKFSADLYLHLMVNHIIQLVKVALSFYMSNSILKVTYYIS